MSDFVCIAIESPTHVAVLDVVNCTYKIVRKPDSRLCSGYAYFKKIEGEKKLVALLSYRGKLYLFLDKLYQLKCIDMRVSLKEGFFKKKFILFENEKPILEFKYKPSSYDASVLEGIADMYSNQKMLPHEIDCTIKFLEERDPDKRRSIDESNVKLLSSLRLR